MQDQPQTLLINGLSFVAKQEKVSEFDGLPVYTLTSARGVKYRTMRRVTQKEVMFIVKNGGIAARMGNVVLHENAEGTLTVHKS